MKQPLKDGWHDLPATDYHKLSAMSSGALKELCKSPQHCYHYLHDAEYTPPTEAMLFGSAFHSYALEYHRNQIAALPEGIDRRTKAGKQAYAEALEANEGKTIIKAEQYKLLEQMINAIRAHPAAEALFKIKGQLREASGIYHDDRLDLACKVRPDILSRHNGLIVDLKTTVSAHPDDFRKTIANGLYYLQAYWYTKIAAALDGKPYRFVIIAVEKSPPFGVMCYEIDALWLKIAKEKVEHLLDNFADCVKSNNFPVYGDEIALIEPPAWIN